MTTVKTPPAQRGNTPSVGVRRFAGAMTSRGLALFGEMIVVSLTVALMALPAVTALPALAAGGAHLRRHVGGETDSQRELWRDFFRALRRGWLWGALTAAAFAAIALTLSSQSVASMPGIDAFRWISIALGASTAVVLLRATAMWQPASRWSALIHAAAEVTVRDPRGSLLLLLAFGLSFTIVWMFAPLVVLVPGMLVLAARAVTDRRAS